MKLRIFFIFISLALAISGYSCGSCKKEVEPEVTIASGPLVLEGGEEEEIEPVKKKKSKIKHIEIGPRRRRVAEEPVPAIVEPEPEYKPQTIAALPPDTYEETDLSARLREKMLDAYAGQEEAIPDVKIYLSDMRYDEFVNYYKGLGYSIHTVAVPATQVIEPVLEQRPELVGKLDMAKYENTVIHQVMVDGAGISAADKYIDPDTFEVVEKTFVTKTSK